MKNIWQSYSLSIVLASLFLASWMLQGVFQIAVEGESWGAFFAATFENWESEFLQLFSFVVLATYFVHRDSPQSRDGDDTMQRKIDAIQLKVDQLIERGNHLPVVTTEASGSDE